MTMNKRSRTLTVTIYGKEYQLACDDGQEAHLGALAQAIDERAHALTPSGGRINDATALVLAAITFADEVSDLQQEVAALRAELQAAASGGESPAYAELESQFAQTIENIAERIETIAQSTVTH